MFAVRQIVDDPQDFIAVPPEMRHRKTEVIFISLDETKSLLPTNDGQPVSGLASLAGCWEGELERPPQGEYEIREELD